MSLIHWWPLNGDTKDYGCENVLMQVASGTSATLNGTGKVTGKCYSNNSYGTGAYVSTTTINPGTNQSMFAWIKFTSLNSESALGGAILGTHRYQKYTGMGITIKYVSSTTGYLSVNTGTGSARTFNTYCGSTLLSANTWYHVGFTYDGSQIKLYVNGNLDGSHNFTGMSTPEDYVMIGAWSLNSTSGNGVHSNYKLNGLINDARVYNHALSKKEVKEISKGLVLHYNFEDRSTNLLSKWTSFSSGITIDNTHPLNDWPVYKISVSGATSNTYRGISQTIPNLKPGDVITMSCWIYTENKSTIDQGSELRVYQYHTDGTTNWAGLTWLTNHTNGVWKFYSRQYTLDSNLQSATFNINVVRNGTLWVSGIKVEYGNIASTFNGYKDTNNLIYDNSGYSNNGTINGTCKLITPSNSGNYCMLFENGVTDYLSNSTFVWPRDKITISFWWKSNDTTPKGNYHIPIASAGNGGNYEISIPSNGQIRGGFYINGTRYVDNGTSTKLLNGNWHLCTMTYDGTIIKRYVDAIQEKSTSIVGTLSGATGFTFGHYGNDLTYAIKNGYISDIKIYATALSASDILAEYNRKASIDRNGNLFTSEIVEEDNANTKFTRKAQALSNTFATTMTLDDGSVWIPICMHYVPDGLNTSSSQKYSYTSRNIWNNFGAITNFERPESGQYEFYVMQQTAVDGAYSWFRFKQNINPLTATWADVNPSKVGTNVTRISSSETNSYAGMYWTTGAAPMTFANTSNGNWYGCGITAAYQGGIPGYNGQVVKGWQLVYMRITNPHARMFKNGLFIPTDIIEN